MYMKHDILPAPLLELVSSARSAVDMIPPLWPLSATVAVNPFLGQAGEGLPETAARLGRAAGIALTQPRTVYLAKIEAEEITEDDLKAALATLPQKGRPANVKSLLDKAGTPAPAPKPLPTIADLAAEVSGLDWPGLIADRIGFWAGSYFDEGQALWPVQKRDGAYTAWQDFARRDLTPEIEGLRGFAAHVNDMPLSPWRLLGRACEALGVSNDAAPQLFHRLLMDLGGWAQLGRYRLWQTDLAGADETDTTATELLCIRLVWEEALFVQYREEIGAAWTQALEDYATEPEPTDDHRLDAILQIAAERAAQRQLLLKLAATGPEEKTDRPALQAAFCIDVRSEVYRRALESVDPRIETIGFAGFFGLGVSHKGFASDIDEARLPVLLSAGVTSESSGSEAADFAARIAARAARAWGRFKLAAVSSFAFVEAMGPVYGGKLIRDALAVPGKKAKPEPAPRFAPDLDAEARIATAKAVLGAMSMTENFAKVVILAGHGASVVNNPHESALHCGACGGYSGEVNARLLAGLLNDPEVRKGLAEEGVEVPKDTVFVPALHDTTTDEIRLYEGDTAALRPDLAEAKTWLRKATLLTKTERALRLPRAKGAADIDQRARNWAEVRPEWALAGCAAFIAAPRSRTAGRDFGGRTFLHSYDWRADEGFGVLELILTAPVVVASWISLQYYGSSVAPQVFGGGNKLLHNVVGGFGVVEGNGGKLRAGLPWQSVHDGERLVHDPLRLTVVVEAPRDAIAEILERHPGVQNLFDNGWLSMIVLDEEGGARWRYEPGRTWSELSPTA